MGYPHVSLRGKAVIGAGYDHHTDLVWLGFQFSQGLFADPFHFRLTCRLSLEGARKGTFGHGMSAGGGWELTAQYLGYQRGEIYPTPLARGELNEQIAGVHEKFIYDRGCAAPRGAVGKLSMGVGGINACVVSRPLTDDGGHDD